VGDGLTISLTNEYGATVGEESTAKRIKTAAQERDGWGGFDDKRVWALTLTSYRNNLPIIASYPKQKRLEEIKSWSETCRIDHVNDEDHLSRPIDRRSWTKSVCEVCTDCRPSQIDSSSRHVAELSEERVGVDNGFGGFPTRRVRPFDYQRIIPCRFVAFRKNFDNIHTVSSFATRRALIA
jgi:hypothetical protein